MAAVLESGENYLETILMLEKKKGTVRSVDIAAELGFSKPSVSRAMGILRQEGFIEPDIAGAVKLTEKGRQKAASVYERHLVLTGFLTKILEVDQHTAEEDACRMEHVISQVTFEKIKEKLEKI
ncbi:MAG: metal-dependent transcriptional regulator [Oscillospiraceae bacterium]|nr:metal-dependent transcriptional regulator [Oscillospiraceae bacterium]